MKVIGKKYFVGVALAGLFAAGVGLTANAQSSSSLLVTWRADAYAPSSFRGKVLPPRGGSVTATVDLLVNGKPADLSNREIRWFVDNELHQSGRNLKRFTFAVPIQNPDEVTVKAVVMETLRGNIERTILIPVSSPSIVIDVPTEGGYIPAASIAARALPYFFSIEKPDDLLFEWAANGSRAGNETGTPSSSITLDTSGGISGNTVTLGVRAVNPSAAIESAQSSVTLRIR